MVASIFILLFSAGALLYWLRWTVVCILQSQKCAAEALSLAEANHLDFVQVRPVLEESARQADYPRLARVLRHDFQALTYLLRYAATFNVGRLSRQEKLLAVDFHLMGFLYSLTRTLSPRVARLALVEMTSILEHFTGVIVQRTASFSTAAVTLP